MWLVATAMPSTAVSIIAESPVGHHCSKAATRICSCAGKFCDFNLRGDINFLALKQKYLSEDLTSSSSVKHVP